MCHYTDRLLRAGIMRLAMAFVVLCSVQGAARSFELVTINDASQLKYHMGPTGARVYLRNLNDFNSSVLGCCFNYWIDTSTDLGKAMWSTLLSKILTSGYINIGVDSATQQGHLYYVGEW